MKPKKKVNEYGIVFWVHILFVIGAFGSPFFFNWIFVFVWIAILEIQFLIWDGCLLNKLQFGDQRKVTFAHHYLSKLGIHISVKRMRHIMMYYVEILVFVVTVIWQLVLGFHPLLF